MTLWIRIDANIGDNPNVCTLAELRGVSVEACVGLLVILFGRVAEHAPSGDVSGVSDTVLERWVSWKGEPGAFARDFRALFVSDGVIDGWEKRQGKLLERAEKERDRWQRRKHRGDSAEVGAARNVTVRKEEQLHAAAEKPAALRPAPRKKGLPAPYMAVLNPVWKSAYGGDMPKGAATALRPVVTELGDDETLARFRAYCEATPGQYASVPKFCQTHKTYSADARTAASGKAALEELQKLAATDQWYADALRNAA